MTETIVEQPMGKVPLLALLASLAATAPIATDMFLPALPDMPGIFGVPSATVNLALTVYFFSQAIGMLLFGPFSDRYGRKRPLGVALVLFFTGALLSALAWNVWILIGARLVQGLGGGGMTALSTALVKDCFSGSTRQNSLVAIQATTSLAPMLAPLLGAAILTFTDWRGTFLAQCIVCAGIFVLFLRLQEPLDPADRTTGNPLQALRGIGTVARNKVFVAILIATAICSISFMCYVTAASYVYIDFFGLSKMEYSVFFAINAASGLLFVMPIPFLLKKTSAPNLLCALFTLLPLASILFMLASGFFPITFMVCVMLQNGTALMMRPVSVNLMLGLQEGDTGSASALINFSNAMFGCLGTVLISLPWGTYIEGMSVLMIGSSLIATAIWFVLYTRAKSKLVK